MKTHENISKHFRAVWWTDFSLFRPDETCRNLSGWSGSKTRFRLAFLSGGWRQENDADDKRGSLVFWVVGVFTQNTP
jgi:hypothetical protein